jgi:hypothetical protein
MVCPTACIPTLILDHRLMSQSEFALKNFRRLFPDLKFVNFRLHNVDFYLTAL